MDPIPESWPPEDVPRRKVPLFALPNVWLFPYVILPLHIFEERYRQMIEDNLDGTGRIVLGTILEGHENDPSGAPPVHPIAGLGEIGRHERLEDGRYDVLLVGLQRVRITETESDRLYRQVEFEPVTETPVPEPVEAELRSQLIEAILERTDGLTAIPPEVSASHLADLLTLRMPLPHDILASLYGELDAETRARRALEEHAVRPKSPEQEGEQGEGDEPDPGGGDEPDPGFPQIDL